VAPGLILVIRIVGRNLTKPQILRTDKVAQDSSVDIATGRTTDETEFEFRQCIRVRKGWFWAQAWGEDKRKIRTFSMPRIRFETTTFVF
jgi:hypothetical protein